MGNSSSSRSFNSKRSGGRSSSSSSTSKLAARITPNFVRETVSYIQQKNNKTPTRTPTRRRDRVNPSDGADIINQEQRFQRGISRSEDTSTAFESYQEEHRSHSHRQQQPKKLKQLRRVNLYNSNSTDSFDQLPVEEGYFSTTNNATPATTRTTTKGFDSQHRYQPAADDIIDQWPCEIVDTDHPVIFVENRVYVGPDDKDQFQCYDLANGHQNGPLPPYSHSTPKTKKKAKKVLFEKINYEKYRQGKGRYSPPPTVDGGGSPRAHWPDDEDEFGGGGDCPTHRHRFSNGEIDRDEAGQKWCQDLLSWSREAAEYQRRRQQQQNSNCDSADLELSSSSPGRSGSSNWFQERFYSNSGGRYNRMASGTEDSGVVCQCDDEEDEECDVERDYDGDDFWGGNNKKCADMSDGGGGFQKGNVAEDGVDSWEALKKQVFIPAERNMTPSRVVVDSEGRLLGRRCSCNSMCTSLCTLETWVDDEVFDNQFNEELERRCGISSG